MTAQNPTTLKSYFETGDKPTQSQFSDLIDSGINVITSATQSVNGHFACQTLEVTSVSSCTNGMTLFDSKSPVICANSAQIAYFTTGDWDIVSSGNPVVNGFKFEGAPHNTGSNSFGVTMWAIPLAGSTDTNIPLNVISYGSGQLSLGSNIHPTCLTVNTTTSGANGIAVVGAKSGFTAGLTAQGVDANMGLNIYTVGTGQLSLGSTLYPTCFAVNTHANDTNGLAAVGVPTGFAPELAAQGTDTDIGIQIVPKGAGLIKISNTASFSSNASVATVLGSVGPVGAHTTIQKWLTIKDSAGNTLYIPAF